MATTQDRSAKRRRLNKILLGAIGAVLLCVCGPFIAIGALFDDDPDPAPSVAPSAGLPLGAVPSPTTAATTRTVTPSTAKPSPKKTTQAPKPKPVYYKDCDAVYDVGKDPLMKGQPGYRKGLDRDGDGEACEWNGDDDPPPPEEPEDDGTDLRFGTCAEANDAGYGPYRRGQDAEYSWYRDRDGDGVVCET